MTTRERFTPYITIRTFADPTASKAIRNISRSDVARVEYLTSINNQLEELNRMRREGQITKPEFEVQRRPLVEDYKASLQIHSARKGGK